MQTARLFKTEKKTNTSINDNLANCENQILMVSDSEDNKAVLIEALGPKYDIIFAVNIDEAIKDFEVYSESLLLVILDVNLTTEDNNSFLQRLKRHELLRYIPFIMTVDSYGEENEIKALDCGAAGILTRPFSHRIIKRRVENIINLHESMTVIKAMVYDQLTGLYSKEYFHRKIRSVLTKNPEKQYDLICSDIEKFKLINDMFGFAEGDRILCEVALAMRNLFGGDSTCARIGPDTFAVLVEHKDDFCEEDCIKTVNSINTLPIPTSISLKFGVYSISDKSMPISQMCDRAVLAVGSIKNKYGETLSVYDDSIRIKLIMEQMLIEGMETALDNKQFVVYFQPKYNIHNDKIAGAEALIRWKHPDKGLIYPGAFIPLFERNGSISRLDRYVWEEACAQVKRWRDMGLKCVPISVNVSRNDLYKTDLIDVLDSIIKKYDIEPSDLHLEITESAYTENPKQMIDVITNLRERGFVIEMDDFGTGYSSLNMLSELPIDVLKLDIAFIQSESESTSHKNIFSFIISLAKWLDLLVIAEGVETKEQIDKIRRMECDYVQGYYFCRPIPAEEFQKLLQPANIDESGKLSAHAKGLAVFGEKYERKGEQRQTILVVDESTTNRKSLRKILEPFYIVAEADNGASALKILKYHGKEIAAAIIDPFAPVMDGCKLLTVMKNDERMKSIPVIMMSKPGKFSEEQALMLGADDFISRPFKQILVLHHVQNIIDSAALKAQQRCAESRQKLLQGAYTDYLTGLLNERGLLEAWENMRDTCLDLFSFLIIDIDNFKDYNDTFGYDAGDEILKTFGNTLQNNLRSDDIIARTGSDEFVIIAPDMANPENALKKAARLCDLATVSCSIGVVVFDRKPQLIDEVAYRADKALRRAKESGKGRSCIWMEDLE